MSGNRGATSLKSKRRSTNPMRDYDSLPKELREWTAQAMLPWRARSVHSAYRKALARTGDPVAALAELDRLQREKVARDTRAVWGDAHPDCAGQQARA